MEYKTGGGTMGKQGNRPSNRPSNSVNISTGNTQTLKAGDNPMKQAANTSASSTPVVPSTEDKKVLGALIYGFGCLFMVIVGIIIKMKVYSIIITLPLAVGLYVVFDAFMNEKAKRRNKNYMGCMAALLVIVASIGIYLAKVLPVLFELK